MNDLRIWGLGDMHGTGLQLLENCPLAAPKNLLGRIWPNKRAASEAVQAVHDDRDLSRGRRLVIPTFLTTLSVQFLGPLRVKSRLTRNPNGRDNPQ